ncbi:MAG: response regulator transcription factor, partial [Gammaproteobacteria bacterium]|nr:response regulator transcription factor [Gammaproteobacteria bacterium]NIV01441.1 response regulator [Phycisphaerae bacterium]NIW46505.1 response regulator [Gammaproteobacteria bacterium]
QQQPDIILLDIMLPGIDGYEVCKNIKADGEFHNTPIVMLSAKTSLDDRLKGYEVGADDYFTKPFDHDELVAKLDKLISYKHSL